VGAVGEGTGRDRARRLYCVDRVAGDGAGTGADGGGEVKLAELKARQLADPAVAVACAEADAAFRVLEAMIRARNEAGLTQGALAARMGTTQSAIARLEGGGVSPTVETLRRYAAAVGKRLRVEMV
jgi:DNA-binding XRE family transcriptional regulator